MTNKELLGREQRISYIDSAKSICIFLMVLGHCIENRILTYYIYSFHMPAMFILSGILYKPHSWKKILFAWSIPFVFFSFVSLIVKLIFGETFSFPNIVFQFIHYRYGLGKGLFVGDWFLWALLGIRFLFGDIKWLKIFRRYYIPIAILATIYMTFETYLVSVDTLFRGYYIGRMFPSLPFFCIGLYLKEKKWKPNDFSKCQIILIAFAFITIPLLNKAYGINANHYGISYTIFFINATLSSLFIFWIANLIPSKRAVETISKGTFVILGAHGPIIYILKHLLPNEINLIIPFVTFIICYYIIILSENYFPMLLGKTKFR
ncbi:MAG: acyltransferase family protein [Prevotella sp.]|nr:acyltransferase family protein [Prevotella sp.]MBR1556137.1 acyltransferase family protein [Prevotella sp.]